MGPRSAAWGGACVELRVVRACPRHPRRGRAIASPPGIRAGSDPVALGGRVHRLRAPSPARRRPLAPALVGVLARRDAEARQSSRTQTQCAGSARVGSAGIHHLSGLRARPGIPAAAVRRSGGGACRTGSRCLGARVALARAGLDRLLVGCLLRVRSATVEPGRLGRRRVTACGSVDVPRGCGHQRRSDITSGTSRSGCEEGVAAAHDRSAGVRFPPCGSGSSWSGRRSRRSCSASRS